MALRFVYRPQVEPEIAKSPMMTAILREKAENIVAGTIANAVMSDSGARYNEVSVTVEPGKATAAAEGPFAHLDEWGGAKGPGPTAAMRRAAASEGRFEEI